MPPFTFTFDGMKGKGFAENQLGIAAVPTDVPPTPEASGEEITIGTIRVGPSGLTCSSSSPCKQRHRSHTNIEWDDFEVDDNLLGHGKQGVVYQYVSKTTNARYAVKEFAVELKDGQLTEEWLKTCENELRNVHADENPYIIKLHNAFFREEIVEKKKYKKLYLFMDVSSGDLLMLLTKLPKEKRLLGEKPAAYIISQVLKGLEILHQSSTRNASNEFEAKDKRQIHRDIKPANILLHVDGMVKIADFGVATTCTDSQQVHTANAGTPIYMCLDRLTSTESGPDKVPYDTKTDIWSVGVVTVELLLGKCPFLPEGGGTGVALYKELYASIKSGYKGEQLGANASQSAQNFVDRCLAEKEGRWSAEKLLRDDPWMQDQKFLEDGKQELIELMQKILMR